MSEAPCTPCDKTDDGEISETEDVGVKPATALAPPICLRCNKPITTEEDFELYADTHYFHTKCVELALAAIVLTAPTLDEIEQMKQAREQMKVMQEALKDPSAMFKLMGGSATNLKNFPLWESDESKDSNR